jgi:hypothetical protein
MVLFGIHVARCAGTTLLLRARAKLRFNEVYSCSHLATNFKENRMEFMHLNNYSTLKFVFGHFLHEEMLKILPGPVQMFAGLREPHARFKSQLLFMAKIRKQRGLPHIDMKEEISLRDNVMCRSIISHCPTLAGDGTLAEKALNVLEHCWCVYFAERFEETTAPIFHALNITPGGQNWQVGEQSTDEIDSETIDLSGARLDQDIILYETAMKRYSKPREISRAAADDLEKFRTEPLRELRLQQSFYRDSFRQYRNDGILDDVIRRRNEMIVELRAELNRYSEMMTEEPAAKT